MRGRVSVGALLSGTFNTYLRSFLLFTGITLLILSPYLVLSTGEVVNLVPDRDGYSSTSTYYVTVLACSLLLILIVFLLTQFAVGAVVYGVFRKQRKERAGMSRCLSTALGRLPQLVGMTLIFGLLVSLPFIPAVLLGFVHPALAYGASLVAWVIFAMIYTSLFVAPAAVVVERLGPRESISRSVKLTRGNRWPVFCLWFVLALFKWAVTQLSTWGVEVVSLTWDPRSYFWCALIVDGAVTVFFTALGAVAVGFTYYQLKVKVEGTDEDTLAAVFD